MPVDSRCRNGRFDRKYIVAAPSWPIDSQLSWENLYTGINGAEPSIPTPTNRVKRPTRSAATTSFAIDQ